MFCLINWRIISVIIGLFFQEIIFTTEFQGSNFLLPTFLTGGQGYFQVANLLLATVNIKPCDLRNGAMKWSVIQYRHRFSLQRKPWPNGSETPGKLCVLPAFEHRFQNQPIRWAFLETINAQKRSATPETLWHFYPIKSSFGGNAVMVTITGKAFVIVYETNQWKWFIFGNAVACVLKN